MNQKFNMAANMTLIGLFFHTFVVVHFLPHLLGLSQSFASFLALWKEAALLLLAVGIVFNRIKSKQRIILTRSSLLILLYFLYALFYVFVADNQTIGFYGLRNEFEYYCMFFIGCNLNREAKDIEKFLKLILYSATGIAVWGILQPLFFGETFMLHLGYGSGGRLSPSFYITNYFFQRAVSTFGSPNELAAFLMIVMLLLIPCKLYARMKVTSALFYPCVALIGCCFMYTLSRSGWVGFFVALLYLAYELRNRKIYYFFFAMIVIGAITATFTGVIEYLMRTITMEDSSAIRHLEVYSESLKFMLQHPLGIGIGMAGPKSQVFLKDKYLNSESSYFVVMYETGLVGISLLLGIFATIIMDLKKYVMTTRDADDRLFSITVIASFIAVLVQYLFLPTIQELAIPSFVYYLSGMAIRLNHDRSHAHA